MRWLILILLTTKLFAGSISLSPPEATTNFEEKLTLLLNAEVKDAIAVQLDLSFDPSIIEIEKVERKELFSWLVLIKRETSIRIVAGVNLDSSPVSGSGAIADISCRAKATGTTYLKITNPWIIKQTLEEIIEVSGATITVTTEITPISDQDIPLFWPNPFYPNIHKKLFFSPEIKEAKLYNINGEMVDANNLSSGVYILVLTDSSGRKYIKRLGVVR